MKKILDNIIKDSNDCWVWQKSCAGSGYGQLTVEGKYWQTHRYAYTQTKGEIPEGLLLRHSCHNIKCCNPDHLTIGTDKDNWHDSKDVHTANAMKRRKMWSINNQEYKTIKEASEKTGIHPGTIIKYTIDGLFDMEQYRIGCARARVRPKL